MSKIINSGENVYFDKTCVALGMFDGLHLAHMKIIGSTIEYAKENNINSGIMIFNEIPANVVGNKNTKKLMDSAEKLQRLSGLDFVYNERFDDIFMNMSCEEFVDFLHIRLHAVALFVGYNYRFGHGASGDYKRLLELCRKYDMLVFKTDEVKIEGEGISSTKIRNYLSMGKIELANRMLGNAYTITGLVVSGFKNGRTFGIRTANIDILPERMLPKYGVYGGECIYKGKKYKCIINVGNNPTFSGEKTTVECHILNFEGEIYGDALSVSFVSFIRDEKKFSDASRLREQILKDINCLK